MTYEGAAQCRVRGGRLKKSHDSAKRRYPHQFRRFVYDVLTLTLAISTAEELVISQSLSSSVRTAIVFSCCWVGDLVSLGAVVFGGVQEERWVRSVEVWESEISAYEGENVGDSVRLVQAGPADPASPAGPMLRAQ